MTENERTVAAVAAMERGDIREMGKLMAASHVPAPPRACPGGGTVL